MDDRWKDRNDGEGKKTPNLTDQCVKIPILERSQKTTLNFPYCIIVDTTLTTIELLEGKENRWTTAVEHINIEGVRNFLIKYRGSYISWQGGLISNSVRVGVLDRKSHPLMKDTIYSNLKNSQRESKVGYALFLSTAFEMNDVLADVLTISLVFPFSQSRFPQFVQQFCKRKASYHFKKTINQITIAYFRYLNS